ncbi:MAG TPA: alpha/beta fold hydrolase [Microthrixaceae bacterium]|nr:alpha/beta fold hydrolase [Microthrixaceae bacterium]
MNAPTGTEPPVVLLHGLATSSARTWGETGWIDLLTDAGREVITVDLPGHGGRPPLSDDADYDRVEEIISAELPDGPVDAVGFSAGARILLSLAVDRPERFGRLVLAGIGASVIRSDADDAFASALAGAADPGAGAPTSDQADPTLHHFAELARSSGTDLDAVVALMRRIRTPLDEDALALVRADVLVVIGDRDFAGPGEPLVERIPGARLVTLPGVDHFATPKSMGFLGAGLDHLGAG